MSGRIGGSWLAISSKRAQALTMSPSLLWPFRSVVYTTTLDLKPALRISAKVRDAPSMSPLFTWALMRLAQAWTLNARPSSCKRWKAAMAPGSCRFFAKSATCCVSIRIRCRAAAFGSGAQSDAQSDAAEASFVGHFVFGQDTSAASSMSTDGRPLIGTPPRQFSKGPTAADGAAAPGGPRSGRWAAAMGASAAHGSPGRLFDRVKVWLARPVPEPEHRAASQACHLAAHFRAEAWDLSRITAEEPSALTSTFTGPAAAKNDLKLLAVVPLGT
mmetsp:Transcript_13184/g.36156  ORF Transcript_13184/g.36156 Transcript_13184/m.36156 type:complete len:273 (+) Transcript_13184:1038-1856(+)